MNFFDKLKDFSATVRGLATRWRLLGALILLIAFGALYLQSICLPPRPAQAMAGKTMLAEKAPAAESMGDNKAGAEKTEPPAGAESPVESVSGQIVEVAARPALVLKGQAKWDEAAKTLTASLAKVTAAATKAGLAPNGRPLTVFTNTDDNGFHYEAMLPIAKAPEGKVKFADGVEVGASPAGKALKFDTAAPTTRSTPPMRRSPLISTKKASTRIMYSSRNI